MTSVEGKILFKEWLAKFILSICTNCAFVIPSPDDPDSVRKLELEESFARPISISQIYPLVEMTKKRKNGWQSLNLKRRYP
ncbi:MAG: hypothetical protein B6247_06375 [Candidatus Parabeggiatoa sp. nov. 2]|nr:MAG: hypothetical protein B6247_06375 [Beggiatoa sp. 4572_84]